eukprot:4748581-Ditylum_brightwellii.AAC.2
MSWWEATTSSSPWKCGNQETRQRNYSPWRQLKQKGGGRERKNEQGEGAQGRLVSFLGYEDEMEARKIAYLSVQERRATIEIC